MNLYEMKLGENQWCSEMDSNILRVPGGWVFRSYDSNTDTITSQCFVPWNHEFMETSVEQTTPGGTGAKPPTLAGSGGSHSLPAAVVSPAAADRQQSQPGTVKPDPCTDCIEIESGICAICNDGDHHITA